MYLGHAFVPLAGVGRVAQVFEEIPMHYWKTWAIVLKLIFS